MLKSAAFAFLLILSGCHKNAASVAKPHGSSLPDLVTAEGAPLFATEPPYTEVVRAGDVWKVYDQGELLGEQRLDDEVLGVFKQACEQVRSRSGDERVLLSAEGKVAFDEMGSAIRALAKSGFWRIEFLVRSPVENDIRSLRLDLPLANGTGPPKGIEPLLIQILSNGSVHAAAGARRRNLQGVEGSSGFEAHFETYAKSAHIAGKTPWAQIHAARECTYQRVIDVMAGLHAQGVSHVYFISSSESYRDPDSQPPPGDPVHLPVPPSREQQTRPLPIGAD